MESFAVRRLTFSYPGQRQPALRQVSLCVQAGEFVVLAGPSGGGKTTLLRQLKTCLAPHGGRWGEILFEGKPLEQVDERTQAARIGFVQQSPDAQLVTDKVWHELAFGLECLGFDTPAIRSRVAEMASFFGIQNWFYRDVSALSGGQKQLLNLAAVMVLQPSVLILDEPTSQLDPIAASDFLAVLGKINRELGTTVLLTEHRLEEALPMADRLIVLDGGEVLCDASPREAGERLRSLGHSLFEALPTPMRIWAAVENRETCPVTVREGRAWLDAMALRRPLLPVPEERTAVSLSPVPALEMDEAWFRYDRAGEDVIRGASLKAYPGELLCVLGGNGTGKTTALSLLSGRRKPLRGRVVAHGRMAVLPQDPQTLFLRQTVRQELWEALLDRGELSREEKEERVGRAAALCGLEPLLERHPYDLSGGEQQRTALAAVLLREPEILLLDEPTKGLDAAFKATFAGILHRLTQQGVCVVMVSHDVEFCARYAHRCALFFDGAVVTENTPRAFFAGNSFYTTAANRMARHLRPEAVTPEDVIAVCGGRVPEAPPLPPLEWKAVPIPAAPPETKGPRWRRCLAWASGLTALGALVWILFRVNLTEILTTGSLHAAGGGYKAAYSILLCALVVFALCVSCRTSRQRTIPRATGRLPRRSRWALAMILLAIPLTIYVGIRFFGDRRYYIVSLLVIAETLAPFAMIFEERKPRARELVILAVLCALGVAGRAAFVALPGFKPVMAMVILAGVSMGAEAGFLTGAVTMFVSNMLFGQGPWTPWQMFSMGIIGFLAGVLFRWGLLRRDRLSLAVFGLLCAIVLYGGLMNPASVLMYQSDPTWEMFLTAYVTGFPVDVVHGLSTALFLWVLARPLLEKLDRVKEKYGLMEDWER